MADTIRFYDELAEHYHLILEDWPAAVRWQGEVLDRLIARLAGPGAKRVLDATCGIGTQAIGLALQGHRVTGRDLSPAAVARARREARGFGVEVAFEVADMRAPSAAGGNFDVVCSLDNAVAHLTSERDLAAALAAAAGCLAAGGLMLISIRDYDALLVERPPGVPERVFPEPGGRRRVYQVWHWQGERTYRQQLFVVRERGGRSETLAFATTARAVTRAELSAALHGAGLTGTRWFLPADSGYYQPIAAARRGAA